MEFRVLGSLGASCDSTPVTLVSARKPRIVLAALLSRADQSVALDWLIDVVWVDRPPVSARQNLQHYVHQLRAVVGSDQIVSQPGSYLIRAGDGLDAARFRRLAAEGRAALEDGDPMRAADRLRAALSLWRGAAYAEFVDCPGIADEAARLEELRLTVYEGWAEAELRLAHYGALVGELTDLVRAHPYRESLRGYLMRALYGAGRQADALQEYRSTRAILAEQLGVEPGQHLRRLHERMLRGDDQLLSPGTRESEPATALLVPRELPADVPGFTGREDALKALGELLRLDPDDRAGAVVICAVTGTAGVGKTALAVHWAHRVVDQFPDGQLYLNLRGHSPGRPLRHIEALSALLGALGVPPQQVPVEVTEAAARYRSHVAGRRMLIVLDNAESPAQVRPLLAGGSGCLILITSRDRLTGLVAHDGARRIELDVLSPQDSVELLGQLLGYQRVALEPAATARLASTCANLPLALRIAAAGLVDKPHRTIGGYVDELAARNPVVVLCVEGDEVVSIRNTLDLSYRALSESAQQMFRWLGLVPCPDFSVGALAALAGTTDVEAPGTMARLTSAHLVVEQSDGRYTMHDLLRQYAAHLASNVDTAAQRAAAVRRLYDWFAGMSVTAARLLYPEILRLPTPRGFPTAMPGLTGAGSARDWFDAERHNLVAAILHAARHGPREAAWRCADALRAYHDQSRHLTDWLTTARAALAAARADGDPYAQVAAYQGLAHVHHCLGHFSRSITYVRRALALASEAGWERAEAVASSNLAIALHLHGHTTESIAHLHHALNIHERMDWPIGRARATLTLATTYRDIGRLREGAELAIRAEGYFPKGNVARVEVAQVNGPLGELYTLLGRFDEAIRLLTSARDTLHTLGRKRSEACCRVWLARAFCDVGCLDEAGESARAAVDLADEIGVPELQGAAHHALALVHQACGNYADAIDMHRMALAIARKICIPHNVGEALVGLATGHYYLGDHQSAGQEGAEALDLAQRGGFAVVEGRALTILGRVCHHLGDTSGALDHARRALANHRQTGHRIGEADTHILLAAIHRWLGRSRRAGFHHDTAHALYEQIGVPDAVRSVPLA